MAPALTAPHAGPQHSAPLPSTSTHSCPRVWPHHRAMGPWFGWEPALWTGSWKCKSLIESPISLLLGFVCALFSLWVITGQHSRILIKDNEGHAACAEPAWAGWTQGGWGVGLRGPLNCVPCPVTGEQRCRCLILLLQDPGLERSSLPPVQPPCSRNT